MHTAPARASSASSLRRLSGWVGGGLLALTTAAASPAAAEVVSELVEPGVIAYRGERFFPIGAYHVRTVGDVDALAEGGFNAAEVIYEGDHDAFGAVLDRALERGVAVVAACRSEDVLAELLVERYADHEAIFMWTVEDDHDDEAYRSFEEVKAKSERIGEADPTRLRYASATAYFPERRARAADWSSFIEVPAVQSYPITPLPAWSPVTEGAGPMQDNYEKIKMYVDAAPGKPVLANIQAFPWHSGGRMPTVREIRAMTYGGLVAGVKGVLFYELRPILSDPAYWEPVQALAAELGEVAPFVLHHEMTALDTQSDDAAASAWVGSDGEGLLVVTHTGEGGTGVSVGLPEGFRRAVPMFPGVDDSLISNGSALAGFLAPGAAQVYRISKSD